MMKMNDWFLVMHVLRSVAAHNDKFSKKSVCEIMVRNFSNVKEVFVNHIPNNKKILQFMHMCYYVGDMQWHLETALKQSKIFIYFTILVILVQCHFTTHGKYFFKTQGIVC